MNRRAFHRVSATDVRTTADGFQRAIVIPHCPACTKPCCRLDSLVLELNWRQVKAFWSIEESRRAFDRQLAAGRGPEEIRAARGHYFIHRKPCPCYDATRPACRVYGQELMPVGCRDFPVYPDRGHIIADLRCEAVRLGELMEWVTQGIGRGVRIDAAPDRDFPFLVTLSLRTTAAAGPDDDRSPG